MRRGFSIIFRISLVLCQSCHCGVFLFFFSRECIKRNLMSMSPPTQRTWRRQRKMLLMIKAKWQTFSFYLRYKSHIFAFVIIRFIAPPTVIRGRRTEFIECVCIVHQVCLLCAGAHISFRIATFHSVFGVIIHFSELKMPSHHVLLLLLGCAWP